MIVTNWSQELIASQNTESCMDIVPRAKLLSNYCSDGRTVVTRVRSSGIVHVVFNIVTRNLAECGYSLRNSNERHPSQYSGATWSIFFSKDTVSHPHLSVCFGGTTKVSFRWTNSSRLENLRAACVVVWHSRILAFEIFIHALGRYDIHCTEWSNKFLRLPLWPEKRT